MKLSKFFLIAGALAISVGSYGAEAKRQRYLIGNVKAGVEARTGYDSNVYSNEEENDSFLVTVKPYLDYEKKFGKGDLRLEYRPEFRWYENRKETSDSEWDHHFIGNLKIKLNPNLILKVYDKASKISGNNVSEIEATGTTVDNNDDFDMNVFRSTLTWTPNKTDQLILAYANLYINYDGDTNAYRNQNTNAVSLDYTREVDPGLKLGAGYVYAYENFYDSEISVAGMSITRDTSVNTLYAIADYQSGPWSTRVLAGVDVREVADDYVDGVDDKHETPYFDASVKYTRATGRYFKGGYTYRTVAGAKENAYFAELSKIYLDYVHKVDERLLFEMGTSYENQNYEADMTRTGAGLSGDDSGDHEEWFRVYARATYALQKDLDVVCGVSSRRKTNSTGSSDGKYTINKYDVGVIYKF